MPQVAPQKLGSKRIRPVAKTTAEWDAVDAQIKERSFFMAGVDNARILAAYRSTARSIAAGEMSEVEGRRHIREFLAGIGYDAGEDAGGIHDLSSRRRLDVSLQTNVDLARGWAQRKAGMWDIGTPGLELYRQQQRMQPRDWTTRWAEAAQAVNWEGVASGGVLVALKTSPIWAVLSRFGHPHPPFDFNSGMRVRDVDADVCARLGLLESEGWQEKQIAAAEESLNEGTEADCTELGADILEQLDDALGSVADIVDGVARMRDINGSTPYTAEEIAEVVGTDTPEGVPNLQRDAVELWAEDGTDGMPEGAKDAMRALLRRTQPDDAVGELQSFFDLSEDQATEAMKVLEEEGYEVPRGQLAESFVPAAAAVVALAAPRAGMVRVVLRWKGPKSARDLRPLMARLGYEPENALYLIEGQRLRVVGKSEDRLADGSRIITYTVTEDA